MVQLVDVQALAAPREHRRVIGGPLLHRPRRSSEDFSNIRRHERRLPARRVPRGEQHLGRGGPGRRSRRNSSGESSSKRSGRPSASPIARDLRRLAQRLGAGEHVVAGRVPAGRAARARPPPRGRARRSVPSPRLPYGQRTTSPSRICGAHQWIAFDANIPGRRIDTSSLDAASRRSISSVKIAHRVGLLKERMRRLLRR